MGGTLCFTLLIIYIYTYVYTRLQQVHTCRLLPLGIGADVTV